jgi:repressor LexA
MSAPRLTERQNQVYEFLRDYIRRQGKPPTLQEIGDALAIRSTNGVHKLVRALESRGLVRREPHAARGLSLVESDDVGNHDGVPSLLLVNRPNSYQPDSLRRRPRGAVYVDPRFLGEADPDGCLVARAGDDGMTGEGIRRGDFLVVQQVHLEDLAPDELAAVLLGERIVVRRVRLERDRLYLHPADRTYLDEDYAPDDPECHVIGRVTALMRPL